MSDAGGSRLSATSRRWRRAALRSIIWPDLPAAVLSTVAGGDCSISAEISTSSLLEVRWKAPPIVRPRQPHSSLQVGPLRLRR